MNVHCTNLEADASNRPSFSARVIFIIAGVAAVLAAQAPLALLAARVVG